MTDKFTPGPWEAYNLDNENLFPSVYIGPPDNKGRRGRIVINEGPSPEMVEAGRNFGTTMETAVANANLIAASPALLAALEAVEWPVCPWCFMEEDMGLGHADDCQRQVAIAMARGGNE